MKFEEFLRTIQELPVIDTSMLLAQGIDLNGLKVQLSRWELAGKLMQLRRGLYVLAGPFRKVDLFELYLASIIQKPSYISLEKAFEFHNLIPEAVRAFTCVTTKRPGRFETPLGVFDYQHIQSSLFWGYQSVMVNKQTAFVATAEKSLLDFFYLKHVPVTEEYVDEMRLQSLGNINIKNLQTFAERFKKPKVMKAARLLMKYIKENKRKEKRL